MRGDVIRSWGNSRDQLGRVSRVGGGTFAVLLVLALTALPARAAEGGTATAGTQNEAWYATVTTDACDSPAGLDCSLLPSAEQYPKDTLHVGISGGQPTTATFIELDMFEAGIPADTDITGGTLTLPVDTAEGDGSLGHQNANIVVCQVTEFFFDTKGSLAKPPKTDCGTSAPAKFSADKDLLAVDLAVFAKRWTDGDSAALAILPADEAKAANDTWHVAFWGKNYGANEDELPAGAEGVEPKPITAKIAYKPARKDDTTTTPPLTDTSQDFGPPELGEVEAPPPLPEVDAPPPEVPEAAPEAPQEATPVVVAAQPEPTFRTFGYPYPIAWLAPLLLIAGFAATGRSLTKKLDPTTTGTALGW